MTQEKRLTHGVLVESAHSPAERTTLLAEIGVVALTGLGEENLVVGLGVLGERKVALGVDVAAAHASGVGGDGGDVIAGVAAVGGLLGVVDGLGLLDGGLLLLVLRAVLDDGVVGDLGLLGVGGGGAAEVEGTLEDVVPADGLVLLDNLAVDVGDEEEAGEDGDTEAGAEDDGGDPPGGLLRQTETGGALVDDGERAHGGGDEEEEGRGPDGPGDGVGPHVDDELDEHEDDGGEAARNGGSHEETGEDGTETLALVPAPLNTLWRLASRRSAAVERVIKTYTGANSGDTDTGDGGHERVGGRNVGRVARAPHDPDGSTSSRTSEGQELNASVVLESVKRDDTTLDGGGGAGTDGQGAGEFEDETGGHGPAVGDGARGDRSGPGVGDIVGAIVEGLEEGEDGADGEDVGVLREFGHGEDWLSSPDRGLRRTEGGVLSLVGRKEGEKKMSERDTGAFR